MHMFQSTTLLILFWTMVRPTLSRPQQAWKRHHIPALIACVLFGMANGVLLVACRYTQSSPSLVRAAELWPALVSGLFSATCLGMFIGRLESIYLDVHPVELVALYTYAGSQTLFRFVTLAEFDKDLHEGALIVDFVLKSLALVLKLGLYYVVRRQLTGGRMAFYMWKVRVLHRAIRSDWAGFDRDILKPDPTGEVTGSE